MSDGAATIGSAYIQLVPSLKGAAADIKKQLDDVANSSDLSTNKLTSALKAAEAGSKMLLKGVMAAGAAAGTALGLAVNSYADYEQLIGGVAKLFGQSADSVIENARAAYQTAGMSANKYMETVTGFSASLLQGLGGDTVAAAKIADMAVRDMADNANTFGTSMDSVQVAYQGFAKQNYTMLDNLKLGYGGTASEMARLINDSGVLGDAITVTAQTVNEVSFDKMISAINETQRRMGITGTTSREAADTISGSFSSMKSAFTNFMTYLGTGNREELEAALDALVTSAKTWAENIKEVVVTIFKSIVDMMPPELQETIFIIAGAIAFGLIPVLVPLAAGLWTVMAPLLPFMAAGAALAAVIWTLKEAFRAFMDGIKGTGDVEQYTGILKAIHTIGQKIAPIFEGIQAAWSVFKAGMSGGENIAEEGSPLAKLYEAGQKVAHAFEKLKEAWGKVFEAFGKVRDAFLPLIDFLTGLFAKTSEGLDTADGAALSFDLFGKTIEVVAGVISLAAEAIVWAFDLITKYIEFFVGIIEKVAEVVSDVVEKVVGFFESLFDRLVGHSIIPDLVGAIAKWFGDLIGFVTAPIRAIWEFITTTWQKIADFLDGLVKGIVTGVTETFDNLKTNISNIIETIAKTVGDVFEGIKTTVGGIWDGIKSAIEGPINAARDIVESVIGAIRGFFDFEITWPHIPMPHFGVLPSGWQIGDLLKGSIPRLNIEWYAKGAILDSATVFGAVGNTLMAGGEAGREAVIPLSAAVLGDIGAGIAKTMEASRNTNSYSIEKVEYSPDSYIARLMEQFFVELGRMNRMGEVNS